MNPLLRFGKELPDMRVPPPGPRSRSLARRLSRVESRNVTRLADDFPVFWSEARGANVRDVDGNVYIDLSGAFGVMAAGHGNPRVVERIRSHSDRLIQAMGDVHPSPSRVELLERLAELAPWTETRTVLASSGAEAVEIALKTAILATDRPGILAFRGGYHGLTAGALSVTAREEFRAPFRPHLYPGVAFAPFPDPFRDGEGAGEGALAEVERVLEAGAPGGDRIGAVILEPIQGRAGVRIPPPGFVAGVAERARDRGAVLILDEILTGCGRTGTFFACEAEEVVPDLVCVGKALGGGLPLSACLGSAEVMDAWPSSGGEALHTSTFLGHPLACAAALAYLEELHSRGLPQRARRLGDRVLSRLRSGCEALPAVGEVRGKGLLLGIELVEKGDGREPDRGAAAGVAVEALRRGLLVLPAGDAGHVVELSPPMVITEEQLDHAADLLVGVLRVTT